MTSKIDFETKGQLISKANRQALDSPKKTNERICFFLTRRVVPFFRFFGESTVRRFVYNFNLPLNAQRALEVPGKVVFFGSQYMSSVFLRYPMKIQRSLFAYPNMYAFT